MRCSGEDVERLDAALASLARVETALRLRLGQVLEVVSRGACFELGFSSLSAYALERCDRSVRWVESARCLARRVERLPELRQAMAFGKISWSMGELLARVAQPGDEARWIEQAESHTVRQVRGLVIEATSSVRQAGCAVVQELAAHWAAPEAGGDDKVGDDGDGDEMCTLTCTVNQEDAWLFEATRALLGQLGVHGSDAQCDAQCEALLAEAQSTLLAELPEGTLDDERWQWLGTAQQRWLQELARWRAQAEALCEKRIRESVLGSRRAKSLRSAVALAAAQGLASLERASEKELDGNVRDLARALARHELELSRRVLRFHRADGWRRLGYASETQYARERLGVSPSSLLAKRALALRLEKLPRVAAALGAAHIGIEAALQLVRVATPHTEVAWVERARQRTSKHLREEVAAALVALRLSGEADCPPPADAELDSFHELERAVMSGRACQPRPANGRAGDADIACAEHACAEDAPGETAGAENMPAENAAAVDGRMSVDIMGLTAPASAERRAWLKMLGSLGSWLESGLQLSAAGDKAPRSSAGRVAIRLRMTRATYAWWRGLEGRARRWLPRGMSWLRFLCLLLWQEWRHLLGVEVAYGQIYIRDRYRCLSPVCSRRDVTPHHLIFRSAGGSDEAYNIGSVCSWCHLQGVHGGRIRAVGTANDIRWELGQPGAPCLVVQGRARLAA